MTSTRFALAVHVAALLAHAGPEPVTSETMAASVKTNPVVVRRVLGMLRERGIVESHRGTGGGWRLARAPETVGLDEIYRCTERGPALAVPRRAADPSCPVGRHIQQVLSSTFAEAEAALEARLARETVASLVHRVLPPGRQDAAGSGAPPRNNS